MSVIVLILMKIYMCVWVCVCVCVVVCVYVTYSQLKELFSVFYFYIYIALTPCLSMLHLGIFASSCRDDLTVVDVVPSQIKGCQRKKILWVGFEHGKETYSILLTLEGRSGFP